MKRNMKNLLIIGIAAITLFACNKLEDLSFSRTVSSGTFIIPAKYCCGIDNDCDGAIDLDKLAKDNNVSVENIKSITIKSAQLKGIDQDCDGIATVNVAVTGADGTKTEILSKENSTPTGARNLDLNVKSDKNLLDFLKGTSPKFKVTGLMRDTSLVDRKYGLELVYTITAQK